MSTAYSLDPVQTAIAVAYHNQMLIADQVLPRNQVGAEKFKWHSYPVEETFRLPDTRAGRRGRLNEVQLSVVEHDSSTIDYGLSASIPAPDVDQAGLIPGYDPVGQHTVQLADYIELDREQRVATLVLDADQYPSANKIALAGNDQWSAAHDDSDPIADILTGMDACLVPPNRMVMGWAVFQKLRVHPRIIKALNGSDAGDVGIATPAQIAALFGLGSVLIGQSRLNTAKYGQEATLGRVWGKHCLLYHVNPTASAEGKMLTFGLTAEYMTRSAGTRSIPPGEMGIRGGTALWVGESVRELIIAPQAAYLIADAVA